MHQVTPLNVYLYTARVALARYIPLLPRFAREMLLRPKLDAQRANVVIQEKFGDALASFKAFFGDPLWLDTDQMYCTRTVFDVPLQTLAIASRTIRSYGFRLDVTPVATGGHKIQMVADVMIANYSYIRLMDSEGVDHTGLLDHLGNRTRNAVYH